MGNINAVKRLRAALRNAPHLLAPLTAGCRGFKDGWAGAAGAEAPAGRWTGEWRSVASGHHGPLRCLIEPLDELCWRATFQAGFARILRACYSTEFAVSQQGDRWTLSGRSDLGRFAGGLYEFDGDATVDNFTARYRSRYDHGVFTLRRADAPEVTSG
jgi:hypothetical protein